MLMLYLLKHKLRSNKSELYALLITRTYLYWLVYPIELETKGMTDIDRHPLYPDLHLEI
jgi:hypothetical protein